jgi:NitT/TauT family transport system substrate-binding protein
MLPRILALVLVLALGGTPAAAQTLVPWRHGVIAPQGDAGFWWMAAEGGFAKAQGLALKMVGFASGGAMLKALMAGEIDSLEGSPAGAMIASSTGGDLKIIGCAWPKLTHSFFARADVHDLASLKGRTIGISGADSLSAVVARAMLARVAIEPSEVKFVTAGGGAARMRAIAGKTIDAAVATNDFGARKDLGLRTLARANDILPSFPRACTVTRGQMWRKAPDDVVRLLAATMTGYAYALGHRAETIALSRRIARLPASDPTPEASFAGVIETRALSPALDIDMARLLWLRDLLAEDGRLDGEFEPGTMTDRSLREEALKKANAK